MTRINNIPILRGSSTRNKTYRFRLNIKQAQGGGGSRIDHSGEEIIRKNAMCFTVASREPGNHHEEKDERMFARLYLANYDDALT